MLPHDGLLWLNSRPPLASFETLPATDLQCWSKVRQGQRLAERFPGVGFAALPPARIEKRLAKHDETGGIFQVSRLSQQIDRIVHMFQRAV